MFPSAIHDHHLSIVVCASREGNLLHRTLATLSDAMADATLGGFRCELLIALHRVDERTAALAHDRRDTTARVIDLGAVDRTEARNAAVQAATGYSIAWLDAGDVCSSGWLRAAAERTIHDDRGIVWHPEHCVLLAESFAVTACHDRVDASREPATYFWAPPYPYAMIAPRGLHLQFPFRPHDLVNGYLGGDWLWMSETIRADVPHLTIPRSMVALIPDAPPDRINFGPPPEGMRLGPVRRD